MSGLAALAACHYLPDMREKIFTVLYKAINSNVKELQGAGKEAMKKVVCCVYYQHVLLLASSPTPSLLLHMLKGTRLYICLIPAAYMYWCLLY